jgi:microcystin degradation protein MlrC
MPRRYVIALIKHETNTFSPISTPLLAFGHGNGPAYGDAARARFAHTNTPMGAYLDIAQRERAQIVTPVAAEAWPSNKASRATFEQLVRPLEEAVRRGCDAVFLDLHGAMVIEDCDDAEGEIVRRLRRLAPVLPISVTLDYHTNLSSELVDNATVITGYKTYPHVDMYDVGKLAGEILVRALDGEVEPVMAW